MRTGRDLGNPRNAGGRTPGEGGGGTGDAWDAEGCLCLGAGNEGAAEEDRKTRTGEGGPGGGSGSPGPGEGEGWRGGREGEGAEGPHRPPSPAAGRAEGGGGGSSVPPGSAGPRDRPLGRTCSSSGAPRQSASHYAAPTSAAVNIHRPTAPARPNALLRVRPGPALKGATAQRWAPSRRPGWPCAPLGGGSERAAAGERYLFRAPPRARTQL